MSTQEGLSINMPHVKVATPDSLLGLESQIHPKEAERLNESFYGAFNELARAFPELMPTDPALILASDRAIKNMPEGDEAQKKAKQEAVEKAAQDRQDLRKKKLTDETILAENKVIRDLPEGDEAQKKAKQEAVEDERGRRQHLYEAMDTVYTAHACESAIIDEKAVQAAVDAENKTLVGFTPEVKKQIRDDFVKKMEASGPTPSEEKIQDEIQGQMLKMARDKNVTLITVDQYKARYTDGKGTYYKLDKDGKPLHPPQPVTFGDAQQPIYDAAKRAAKDIDQDNNPTPTANAIGRYANELKYDEVSNQFLGESEEDFQRAEELKKRELPLETAQTILSDWLSQYDGMTIEEIAKLTGDPNITRLAAYVIRFNSEPPLTESQRYFLQAALDEQLMDLAAHRHPTGRADIKKTIDGITDPVVKRKIEQRLNKYAHSQTALDNRTETQKIIMDKFIPALELDPRFIDYNHFFRNVQLALHFRQKEVTDPGDVRKELDKFGKVLSPHDRQLIVDLACESTGGKFDRLKQALGMAQRPQLNVEYLVEDVLGMKHEFLKDLPGYIDKNIRPVLRKIQPDLTEPALENRAKALKQQTQNIIERLDKLKKSSLVHLNLSNTLSLLIMGGMGFNMLFPTFTETGEESSREAAAAGHP